MKKYLVSILFLVSFLAVAQEKAAVTSKEYQDNLNKEFADQKESPLDPEDFKNFKGLDFFPIDNKFIITAKFVKSKNERVFKMKTSTDRLPKYKIYGTLFFEIEGKQFKLNVYQNVELIKKEGFADYLFLPFSDLTCGKESYIGGRYIDMQIPNQETVVIDFNRAYNPYCAYSHRFSCPIVPLENDLDFEIKAGVMKFHD
ncbi:MAG: DUF1684 domain-containing protein [Bacteroidota bacterium]